MTDWFGGKDPVAQMKGGNDLLMPGTTAQTKAIIDSVKNGTLDEKVLDQNAERILTIVLQSPSFKNFKSPDKPDLKKNAQISKTAAEDGMVLLKNTGNALPFSKIVHNLRFLALMVMN